MDEKNFLPPATGPAEIRAREWLLFVSEMRRRLDIRHRLDAGELRAWRESCAAEPGARRMLIILGNRDMDTAVVLWEFFEARLDWLERRAFAALGIYDGDLSKPTRPAALESLTPKHAAALMSGDPGGQWQLLFAGKAAQQQAPAAETVKQPRRRRKTEGAP